MKHLFVIAYCSILCMACNNDRAPGKTLSTNSDSIFTTLANEYIKGYLDWRPQTAVSLGMHQYDGKIADYNHLSLEAELKRLRYYDQRLDAVDTATMGAKMFYDFRLLRMAIRSEITSFEDIKTYSVNPIVYAGLVDVNLYLKRNYAPLTKRLQHIIAVENALPAVFASARTNLEDSLPQPFIETAIAICEGNKSFMKGDLQVALKNINNDSLMKAFHVANDTAVAAINYFISWLQKEKMPKANNRYAIGEANYKKMLLYSENLVVSPEQILEIGMVELKKEQERFNKAAAIIDASRKPIAVYRGMQKKEHPVADSLLPVAEKHLEQIRQYLIDKNIITVPSEVRVQVKATPEYARSMGTASMDVAGPFEKSTESYYYITPIDSKWTAKQQEDWLTQFDYYTTDNVTIHEAYPGHYTQFLHLNASGATTIEKIFGSYAFVEGWAHYTEIMMMEEGFGNTGDSITAAKYRLAQSGDALLRICRLCVSVKMHCQGMRIDAATKFFMDNWYQGEKPSHQEAMRGSFDPGFLFYTLGKLEILKLRDDYKKQEGSSYSIKKFHDAMLDHGMPPIGLLREVLLKDKKSWPAVL